MSVDGRFGQLAVVMVLLITSIFVVSSIYDTTPDDSFTEDNESVTVALDTWTELGYAGIATSSTDDEAVYNATGALLVEGTDYEYEPSNVSIQFLSTSSDVSAGEEATVTYNYEAKPKMARDVMPTISSAFTLGAVAGIVLIAALILGLVGGFGRRRN